MKLVIRLPVNRRRDGDATLIDATGQTLGQWVCRGKASNDSANAAGNPSRDPTRKFGDTPSGQWDQCRVTARPHVQPEDGIGPRWIPLNDPTMGDALTAEQNGRTDLGIHAGRGDGPNLIATRGCVRMFQVDFDDLCDLAHEERFDVAVQDRDPGGPLVDV